MGARAARVSAALTVPAPSNLALETLGISGLPSGQVGKIIHCPKPLRGGATIPTFKDWLNNDDRGCLDSRSMG